MSTRLRLVVIAILFALLSAAGSLLVLTAIDRRLDHAAFASFDRSLQMHVHALANPALTEGMLALTWIGSIKIFAVALVVVLIFFLMRGRTHAAVLLGASIVGAFVLNENLKLHFHRARPQVAWALGDEHTFSFPSGHSLFAVVLYGSLAYLALSHPAGGLRRLAVLLPAVVMILGIGISRIYLGMHYPTDVLAGFVTGAFWLAAVIGFDRVWRSSRRAAKILGLADSKSSE